MNRTRGLAVFCSIFALAAANVSEAQSRGGVGGGWGGVVLLLHPLVQKELKLDEGQIDKARALVDQSRENQRSMYASLEGLTTEERTKRAREIASAQIDQGLKALKGILKPEQFVRFEQIDLQQRGAAALTDSRVAQMLKLTQDQTERIGLIIDNSVLEMREAPSKARGDRLATAERIQAVRNERDTKAIALLTDAQKLDWKKMTGEPFEMTSTIRPGR
jgi:Spy/CpxP family protein refolding chaperone